MKSYNFLNKYLKNFKKETPPMVVIDKTNYFSFPFFIIGALAGVIAALLYTPDTGENNRSKLLGRLKKINTDKINFGSSQTYKIEDISDEGVQNLENIREKMTDI